MYSQACKRCTFYPSPICYYCMLRSSTPYANPYPRYSYSPDRNNYRSINVSRRFRAEKKKFTTEEAIEIAKQLNISFERFDVEQFRMGLDVELEHGTHDLSTNVTDDNPLMTGKIALAHLNEFPDYYTRLNKMEEEAEAYWGKEEFE